MIDLLLLDFAAAAAAEAAAEAAAAVAAAVAVVVDFLACDDDLPDLDLAELLVDALDLCFLLVVAAEDCGFLPV